MIRRLPNARRRRGFSLAFVMIMLPLGLVALVGALAQADIALREAERAEHRAQSRLLAESALALLPTGGDLSALPINEGLSDIGTMRLERLPVEDGRIRLQATGTAVRRDVGMECRIVALVEGGGAPAPLSLTYTVAVPATRR
jgi:hypothetical protein